MQSFYQGIDVEDLEEMAAVVHAANGIYGAQDDTEEGTEAYLRNMEVATCEEPARKTLSQ